MKNKNKYFTLATAFINENFAGVDGFENFADNNYEAAGDGSVKKYNSTTSDPYEIIVANANLVETMVTLFNSYVNRTAATAGTAGNVAGITITDAVLGTTAGYIQLLGQTEGKPFTCGEVYIEVITGSNAVLTRSISQTTTDGSRNSETRILRPKLDPKQQISTVLDFVKSFNINGLTNLQILIPASTTVQYSFFPEATVDVGRTLSNKSAIRDYVKPMITQPTPIALNPRIIEALGKR